MTSKRIEIVPAILRKTFEDIERDWHLISGECDHIQIDVTDGIFAGEGTFRELGRLKQLPKSEKIELHMMVHTPAHFVDQVIDLNPARCVFHLESFTGTNDLHFVYETLRDKTQSELALGLNPESPNERLDEYVPLIDFVLFMGYNPGWADQPINPLVYNKIREWRKRHPDMSIAADGHVTKETVEPYVKAGATILCSNSAIFKIGDPGENFRHLQLLAQAAAGSV
jgi:pentose-5-phosphate-3-epimerase